MNDSSPKAPCKQCHESIPIGAKLCSHCHSYQDWRNWLSVSSTVLALLTALVSVTGLVVPQLIETLHTPKSQAALESPSLEGTTLRMLAVNKGDAPAVLIRARIAGEYLAGATKIRLHDDSDALIPPGAKLFTFDIIPLLDENQSYVLSLEAFLAVAAQKPLPPTSVIIDVAQSDGTIDILRVAISDEEMFSLLRNNADRCSAVDKPDFLNGCIGNGDPMEGRFLDHLDRPN